MATEDFYAHVPKKRVAAGALIRDGDGRILLLEPAYKATWEIPGGIVEGNESPRAAAHREVLEELGLRIPLGALLCVDWNPAQPPGDEALLFLFDGGLLDAQACQQIRLPAEELRSWRWVSLEDAGGLADPRLVRRLAAGVLAVQQGTTAYLEYGD